MRPTRAKWRVSESAMFHITAAKRATCARFSTMLMPTAIASLARMARCSAGRSTQGSDSCRANATRVRLPTLEIPVKNAIFRGKKGYFGFSAK
jgi:hypothetical protein